jgi:LmbE family N-acetylglucosaminyl deacetylase
MPEIIEPPSDKRIAIITAHPDDMEHWCAGTVIQAVECGCEARLLLVTSGDKGSGAPAGLEAAEAFTVIKRG